MSTGWIILRKQEMTKLWIDDKFVPVTLLWYVPQEIVRYKTLEKDGYLAAVVWAWKKVLNKEKWIKEIYSYMTEFDVNDEYVSSHESGSVIDLSILEGIESVTLRGVSKGKWYQWVIRRHNFKGWRATHGSKFHRLPGSIGTRKPRRTVKWTKLPGHMWLETITLKNVRVVDSFRNGDMNLVAVKWSVPWAYNSFIKVELN